MGFLAKFSKKVTGFIIKKNFLKSEQYMREQRNIFKIGRTISSQAYKKYLPQINSST